MAHNDPFATAADFEARLCPMWPKRNIKTKLQINTSPEAGINTMLWRVAFSKM